MPSKDIEKRREASRKWMAKSRLNPEYKAKEKAIRMTPEFREKKAAYMRHLRATNPEVAERQREYLRRRNANPEFKKRNAEYARNRLQIPWVQAAIRAFKKAYRPRANFLKWQRRQTDENYRLKEILSRRVYMAVSRQDAKKCLKTSEVIGCSIQELKDSLERQFEPGMTWANQGKWHIDHITPCSFFDLSKESEQRRCFHWTNLRPLWAIDNLRKGDKLTIDFQHTASV